MKTRAFCKLIELGNYRKARRIALKTTAIPVIVLLALTSRGTPTAGPNTPGGPCDSTDVICSTAGTGMHLFDGDGHSLTFLVLIIG